MDLGPSFVADEQSFELVEPGEAALDDPAVAAQRRAVVGLAAGDLRPDAALADLVAVRVGVVAAVGEQLLGPPSGPAEPAAHMGHPVHEWDQLGDVVPVAAAQAHGGR